jgi:hypothetical protein
MACRWATAAVEAVPVFGERGALLEHAVFGLFYNYPLTLRRRMGRRAARRRTLPPRIWHAVVVVVAAAGLLAAIEQAVGAFTGAAGTLRTIWPAGLAVPILAGAAVTAWAGGLALPRRIILATVSGIALGVAYALAHTLSQHAPGAGRGELHLAGFAAAAVWPAFLFAVAAPFGALATEILTPENNAGEMALAPSERTNNRRDSAGAGIGG